MTISSRLRRPVLLSGPMGSGKSTVGPIAARELAMPFVDLDQAIIERAGRSIAEVFERDGEARFRDLEREVFQTLLSSPECLFISLGGGTLVDGRSRREAFDQAVVVGLHGSAGTFARRIGGSGARPALDAALGGSPAERLARTMVARRDVYRAVHAFVAAEEGSPRDVAARVVRAATDHYVAVPLDADPYAVRFTGDPWGALSDTVAALRPSSVFLASDENVMKLYGDRARDAIRESGASLSGEVVFASGEAHKTLSEIERSLQAMVSSGVDRGSLVVALGGGVVTDMGGFASAIFARGIRWLGVPTTLLGMVDASVGGKTGVDFANAKNLVGAIHQPSTVILSPGFSRTESARAVRGGLSELVKSLALGDPDMFSECERWVRAAVSAEGIAQHDPEWLALGIRAGVAVKARIVADDPHENGHRAVLNLGHTFGHALEASSGFSTWTHGEAVSVGMVVACRIGEAMGVTEPSVTSRLHALLSQIGLPTNVPPHELKAALPWIAKDKKRVGGRVRLVLLEKLGTPCLVDVSEAELMTKIEKLSSELWPPS